jgi:aryl-alcohol dehydrogenase-like predicted oxidoreductase
MAYSPLLGGAYVKPDKPITAQYQNAVTDFRIEKLKQVANELHISPNAVVLRWMMQSTPPIIPIVAGSLVRQIRENLNALSIELSAKQLDRLNHDIDT